MSIANDNLAPPLPPFRLAEGVHLEDSDVLLPWHPFDADFTGIGDAEALKGVRSFRWMNRKCFGGLDISLWRDGYHDTFHLRFPTIGSGETNGPAFWEPTLSYLAVAFGMPHERGHNKTWYTNYPWAKWTFGPVQLSHGVQEWHGDFCTTAVYLLDGWSPWK